MNHSIFSLSLRWLSHKLLSLILIIGILAIGRLITNDFRNYQTSKNELPKLETLIESLNLHRSEIRKESLARITKLENDSFDSIKVQLKKIAQDIQKKKNEANSLGFSKSILGTHAYIEHKKIELEIAFLEQEQSYLSQLSSEKSAETELERLRQKHIFVYRELKLFEVNNPIRGKLNFGKHKELLQENHIAYVNYQTQLKRAQSQHLLISKFNFSDMSISEILSPLNQEIKNHKENISSWFGQIYSEFNNNLNMAIKILILATLSPVIFRSVFYFILAPLASRRPPICIYPNEPSSLNSIPKNTNKDSTPQGKVSAVSIQLHLNHNDELLIHPDYIQSSSVAGKQDTKWLLSNSLPISSILSGMLALSRIRTDSNETIDVSATNDPLIEIGIISLSEGEGIVLQPRSLVGILRSKDSTIRITRHWRLFSLHAWLTLQLRYLVFHGPSKLIIKGCRGIRLEAAGNGRRISQLATIGFSANLKYSTTRSETFFPYLTAKQSLLKDSFSGEHGFYLYEELPRNTTTGITTRGLEGISDAIMKIFGI